MQRTKLLKATLFVITGAVIMVGLLAWWATISPITSPPNRLWQYVFWKVPRVEYAFLTTNSLRNAFSFISPGDEKYDFYGDNEYKNILVLLYLEDSPEILEEVPQIVEKTVKTVFNNKNIEVKIMEILPENKKLAVADIAKYNEQPGIQATKNGRKKH